MLSRSIDPGAFSQPVFDCLWLLFKKGTQLVCEGVEKIWVGFLQGSVTGLKLQRGDHDHTVVNGIAFRYPGQPTIHNRCTFVVDLLELCGRRVLWMRDGSRAVAGGSSGCVEE